MSTSHGSWIRWGFVIIPRAARTILAVPPESVDSERLFSLAGLILNRFRTRLAPETAEAQILLSYWLRKDAAIANLVPELREGQAENVAFIDFLSAAIQGEEEDEEEEELEEGEGEEEEAEAGNGAPGDE